MHKLVVALLAGSIIAPAQTGTGSIQGAVTEAKDKPIAAALVTALRSGLPPLSQTVQTGPDGSYHLKNLAPGTYTLCAQVPGGGYLDPCQFGGSGSTVTLASGQQSTGNLLKLKAGSVLKIHFNDASGQLSQKTKDGHEPDLFIGVLGPGPQRTFYPAHKVGSDKAGADYNVTIPLDTPLSLSVTSTSLKLADSAGAALAGNAGQQAFQHATGDPNPPSFTFTIAGVKP